MTVKRGSITKVVISGVSQSLLSPSEKRESVRFGVPSNNAGTVNVNNRPLASPGDGIQVATNLNTTALSTNDVGDLVKGPWYCIGNSAGDFVFAIEGLS